MKLVVRAIGAEYSTPLKGLKGKELTGQTAVLNRITRRRNQFERYRGSGSHFEELAVLPLWSQRPRPCAAAESAAPIGQDLSAGLWRWCDPSVAGREPGRTVVSGMSGRPLRPSSAGGGVHVVLRCEPGSRYAVTDHDTASPCRRRLTEALRHPSQHSAVARSRGYLPPGDFPHLRRDLLRCLTEAARRYGGSLPLGVRQAYLLAHPAHI
jgi:hypothetical protein